MLNTALAFPREFGRMRGRRLASVLSVIAGVAWTASMPTMAQTQAGTPAIVGQPVEPLRITADPARLRQGVAPRGRVTVPESEPLPQQLPPPRKPVFDPKAQIRSSGASGASGFTTLLEGPSAPGQISAPIVSVPGAPAVALPPDTVGDVGPNHYIQMTNNSGPGGSTGFFIVRKDGTAPPVRPTPALSGSGPFNFGALWPAGTCNSNLGDPIVVYDHLADRWLLSQFAQPGGTGTAGFLCVAISQTPDPTNNTWFLYTMGLHTNLPDYPKIGVWSDGYYVTTYESPNLAVYVLDRANMLIGQAAGFLKLAPSIPSLGAPGVRDTRILPADLDGAAPPAGAAALLVRPVDGQQDTANPTDRIEVYEGRVNWVAGTFTVPLVDTINPTAFDIMTCNRGGTDVRSCIPQPGAGTQNLDALSNRPMMQLRYRNFGSHQTLVFNQTIDVQGSIQPVLGFTPTNEVAGVRWTELRKTTANWVLHQEGSYAPQPNGATTEPQLLHRWMGSAAMDRFGNIGLAYSIVNGDATNPVNPGLRYTGRRFDDVLNLLPQGEQVIVNGTAIAVDDDALTTAPAPLSERWGDYSALSVDPVDDCTFWYTSHVAGGPQVAGNIAARPTRIASFRFADCATDLAISKSGSPNIVTAGNLLTYSLAVSNLGPLDASGVTVVDTLPAGVSYVSNNAGCTLAGSTLTCNLGLLAKDASRIVQVTVRVQPNVVSSGANSVTNVATVASNQGEANPANNTATLITQVVDSADLSVSKQCKPDVPALSGSTATCTMFVNNAGPSDARSVVLTDTLLGSGAFTITNTNPGSPTCTSAGGVVTCNLGTLAPGATVPVAVSFTATGSVDVNDTARVSSATPDPDSSNNTATGRVSFFASADLSITKLDTPDPVVAGTNLTYTINVANAGPSAATNVVVTDILPAQVKVLSATPSGAGSCGGTTGAGDPAQPLTCNLGSLASGASTAITVLVKVDSDVPQGFTLVNNATVSSDATDANNANNKATATTLVNAVADLLTVKTSDKAVYKPSTLVTYTITVSNLGPSKALAVQVTDNLPTDRQALYQSDTGGCTKSGLTLTCQLGDMAVGTSRSFNIYMVVKGSRGDVTNTATAVSSTTDPITNNNISTRVVRIGN
jgi:uncharacterized repeat protein (TIGR01451 family)